MAAGLVYRRRRAIRVSDALLSFKRQALHANRLTFEHPVSGERLRFTAPLPYDLQQLLDTLSAN